jgi:hypothetical protein
LLQKPSNDKGDAGDVQRRYRTGDQNWVRERNLAILLEYLWQAGGPISRARLTEISGLNKSTVGSLLAQLQSWGLVKETGTLGQGPGRPGVLIDLNPDTGRIIGAEIGVDFVSAVVADLKGQVLWRRRSDLPPEGPGTARSPISVLKKAERLVQEAVNQASRDECRLYGIGLGVPGLVDHATGTLLFAPNLGWKDVPVGERWRERFSVPVVVENEANAAAVGEHMLGVARQAQDFVYLSAGIGLGGGACGPSRHGAARAPGGGQEAHAGWRGRGRGACPGPGARGRCAGRQGGPGHARRSRALPRHRHCQPD